MRRLILSRTAQCPLTAPGRQPRCHMTPCLASRLRPGGHGHPPPVIARNSSAWTGALSHQLAQSCNRPSTVIIGRQVSEALANGHPVVALESTVITHGLPEPQNLELALSLEAEIAEGHWWPESSEMRGQVTPATVGIIRGQAVVGLTRDQIEFLARAELSRPIKASRRDIPVAQANKLSAGTTVSATMALATSCAPANGRGSIAVFATGGLGGVHLGGERSMDISADLYELARSPMGLVSSGFKSFLDTRRSLEFLETMGCTVTSLRALAELYVAPHASRDAARTGEEASSAEQKREQLFPGFFTTASKELVKSPWQCDDVHEAARILYHCLGQQKRVRSADNHAIGSVRDRRSMLLACPIPTKFSLDENKDASGAAYSQELLERISAQIDERLDLSGTEKTPLILAELNRETGGKTLRANLELLRNNARIGAHLAYEYSSLLSGGGHSASAPSTRSAGSENLDQKEELSPGGAQPTKEPTGHASSPPIVIGCTMIDMHVRTRIDDKFKANPHYSGVTFDGEPHLALGGVGRNLAAGIELLGHEPLFVTSLAGDNLGQFARSELARLVGERALGLRVHILDWTKSQGEDRARASCLSSCFALVLVDSLTGQCEYVIANLDAKRAISRASLIDNFDLEARLRPAGSTPLVVLDSNLLAETTDYVLQLCHTWRVPVFLEPTDVACLPSLVANVATIRRASPLAAQKLESLAFLSPNVIELFELVELFRRAEGAAHEQVDESRKRSLEEIERAARELMSRHLPELECLLVTMDKRGVLVSARSGLDFGRRGLLVDIRRRQQQDRRLCETGEERGVRIKHYPPLEVIERPVSGSGAGDCLASGFISGLLDGRSLDECTERGLRAALCALKDTSAVPEKLRELPRA